MYSFYKLTKSFYIYVYIYIGYIQMIIDLRSQIISKNFQINKKKIIFIIVIFSFHLYLPLILIFK